jgi:hypothetical protein
MLGIAADTRLAPNACARMSVKPGRRQRHIILYNCFVSLNGGQELRRYSLVTFTFFYQVIVH